MALLTITKRNNSIYATPQSGVFDASKIVYAYADPSNASRTIVVCFEKDDPVAVMYQVSQNYAAVLAAFGSSLIPLTVISDSKRAIIANITTFQNAHVYRGPTAMLFNKLNFESVMPWNSGADSKVEYILPYASETVPYIVGETPAAIATLVAAQIITILPNHTVQAGEENGYIEVGLIGSDDAIIQVGNNILLPTVDYTYVPATGAITFINPLLAGQIVRVIAINY